MTDYIRKLVKQQLGLMYLPYTKEQQKALHNLLDKYPTTNEAKTLVELVMNHAKVLISVLPENASTEPTVSHTTILKHIDGLCSHLYKLPVAHLWIVSESVIYALSKAKLYLGRPNEKVDTAIEYIREYHAKYGKPTKTFEQQLVEDITTLSLYNYPHPEMTIAMENAEKVLDLYYTETEASKLFITDMRYKIKRYLGLAYETLGVELINRFKYPAKKDTQPKAKTIDEIYQELVMAISQYEKDKDNLQQVLELATLIRSYPYKDVEHLPDIKTYLNMVDNIHPFKPKVQP